MCDRGRTQLILAALRDAVAVHLAEVPGAQLNTGRSEQHAGQPAQITHWRHDDVAGSMRLEKHHVTMPSILQALT